EDQRVRSDAQSQGKSRGEREDGRSAQGTQGVADVGGKVCEQHSKERRLSPGKVSTPLRTTPPHFPDEPFQSASAPGGTYNFAVPLPRTSQGRSIPKQAGVLRSIDTERN